jgi:hypothetical protein
MPGPNKPPEKPLAGLQVAASPNHKEMLDLDGCPPAERGWGGNHARRRQDSEIRTGADGTNRIASYGEERARQQSVRSMGVGDGAGHSLSHSPRVFIDSQVGRKEEEQRAQESKNYREEC